MRLTIDSLFNYKLIIRLILYIILILCVYSCCEGTKFSGYEIRGNIKHAADSTMVYLMNEQLKDSTYLIGERFSFKGKVDFPVRALINLGDRRDSKPIWLENTLITFSAVKDSLESADVTGGKIQSDMNLQNDMVAPIVDAMMALERVFRDSSLSKIQVDSIYDLHEGLTKRLHKAYKEFISNHPNSLESVLLLNSMTRTWERDTIAQLYARLDPDVKKHSIGRSIERYIELNIDPKIGEPYVDFKQTDSQGNEIKLSEVLGKFTLVEFWASWCKPCREENPGLVQEYNTYKDLGFQIVGVSLDENKANWLKAISDDRLPWLNLTDLKGPENPASIIYNINGIPDNILIDHNGIIIARNLRKENLKTTLAEIFD